MSGTTMTGTTYRASATMPLPVEFIRQLPRRRTLVAYLLVIALPVMVSLAVKFGSEADSGRRLGSGSADLVGLATAGAANFTVTMFFCMISLTGTASRGRRDSRRMSERSPVFRMDGVLLSHSAEK